MTREWYLAHREAIVEKNRIRRAANPEKYKATNKRWREANAVHLKDYMDKWRADNKEHLRQYAKDHQQGWSSSRAERVRGYQIKSKYGVTPEHFREMLIGQAGRCLICHRVPERTLVIDHDHATGRIRGLLCNRCNRMLGIAEDSPKRLAAAIRYLQVA